MFDGRAIVADKLAAFDKRAVSASTNIRFPYRLYINFLSATAFPAHTPLALACGESGYVGCNWELQTWLKGKWDTRFGCVMSDFPESEGDLLTGLIASNFEERRVNPR